MKENIEVPIIENNSLIIPLEDSKRITSLRFLLIVFVVFIHANLSADEALNYYHYDFIQPKWIEIFKFFVCHTLGGSAVPLFFLFSSYLQFSKNDSYHVLLKKRSKSLLIPYILWTVITIILYYIAQSIPQTESYFKNPINIIRDWGVLEYLKAFTYHNKNFPLVFQFWFCRDLMILIILSPLIKSLCTKFPGIMIILSSVFAVKEIPIFFTNSSSLFFYVAGYYFATYKISFFRLSDRIKLYEYIIVIIISLFFDFSFNSKYSFGFLRIIISSMFILKVSNYFILNQKIYEILEYFSGYSFFLYAVHMPFLGMVINKLSQKYIPLHGFLCLIQFLIAALLILLVGTLFGIMLNKFFPKIFKILNGGRI